MQNKMTVLIADGLAKDGLALLKVNPKIELLAFDTIERTELKERLPQVDVLIVRSRTQVDCDLLERARNLKLVLRAGIGLDNVDVPTCTDHGIVVMNAPTGNIVTTAEHALAMIFAVSRHIPQADATLRSGKWEKKKFQGNELRGKTLGLLGLGNIGRTVAERALALGMRVIAHDPYVSPEAAAKQKIHLVEFEDLLKSSDYISIHVPLLKSTQHLLNESALKKMKKGAYLINCARGGIVDEKALLEMLANKHLAGAALDVFETEPLPPDSPLLKCTDLVLTPHLGASTDEAQIQVSLEVADQISLYVEQGVLKNAINVPNITLDQLNAIKPYVQLCEKLGSFATQAGPKNVKKIKVHYEGTVSTLNRELLTLSVLKGFLTPVMSTTVNYVNARKLLKERGIRVEESFEQECTDYNSLVELTVSGDEPFSCSGTLFGKEEPRIIQLDHFNIDAIPTGCLLYTKNVDQPGVVGSMGTLLGTHGVNIARMHLGRNPKKAEAIALINIDSEPSTVALEALSKVKGMLSVKAIRI
ncbi:MAG: phosphoglycerate dehydrogenase [Deltaproteobacteria bacterium]|nr:phosphoglycerate dehydrogenase [Deltaproteobacteria bacterium]